MPRPASSPHALARPGTGVPRLLVLLAVAGGALLAACGGGGGDGGDGGSSSSTGFLLRNNGLTTDGRANTHTIVAFRWINGQGSQETALSIAPGATAFVPVASATYNLEVTFDDGQHEGLQVPADQVAAITNSQREVLFLYGP